MKLLLTLTFLFSLVSCGDPQNMQVNGVQEDTIVSQGQYKYSGILKIYRASSGCMGSGGSHISYLQKKYEIGSKSSQSFHDLIDSLFNNTSRFPIADSDACFNFYNLNFNGEFTQELVFTNGQQVMKDVIHVSTHQVK